MSHSTKITSIAIALMVALLAPTAARAATRIFHFTGEIAENASSVVSEGGLPGIAVGDSFTGRIVYDDAVGDTQPNPGIGTFAQAGPPASLITMTVDGLTFSSSTAIDSGTNDNTFSRDNFFMTSSGIELPVGWSVGGSTTEQASFTLADSSQTAFSSDSLPTHLDLSDFDTHEVRIYLQDYSSASVTLDYPGGTATYTPYVSLRGNLETLTAVPEPTSFFLAVIGGLLCFRHRGPAVSIWLTDWCRFLYCHRS